VDSRASPPPPALIPSSDPGTGLNEAVQLRLAEDAEDLAAFEDRVNEANLPYEEVVKDLKRRGKI